MKEVISASAVCLLTSGAAVAAPVLFDLRASSPAVSSWSLSEGGISMTVTAGSFVGGFNFPSSSTIQDDDGASVSGYVIGGNTYDDDALVDPDSDGTGVINNGGGDGDDDIDGSGWDDFLILSFDQQVRLEYVNYSRFGFNDDYRYIYDTTRDGVLGFGDFVTFADDDDPDSSFPALTGTVFGILATGNNDEFAVRTVGVSAVPPPAAGWLLLAGFGGLAAMRRRKS